MEKYEPWLPEREQDFADFCERLKIELTAEGAAEEYGWPADDIINVMSPIHIFLTARAAYLENDSSDNRDAKNKAMKEAKKAVRYFVRCFVRNNPKMNAAAKKKFNIKEPDPKSPPIMEIDSYPASIADTSMIRVVKVNYVDSITMKRAKPVRIHGAELKWAILDHFPADVKELINSEFDTSSPITLTFEESQRGKKVYYAMRWETNTNVKGPFGPIETAVIP